MLSLKALLVYLSELFRKMDPRILSEKLVRTMLRYLRLWLFDAKFISV